MPDVTWDDVRESVNELMIERGVWAGAPLPIDHLKLTVEPRYPYQGLNGVGWNLDKEPAGAAEECPIKVRNCWRSIERNCIVYVCEENGRVFSFKEPLNWPQHRHRFEMNTLGVAASPAWTLDAETEALQKLLSHVGMHKFKCYVLAGLFIETSPRSQVVYVFRKLKPTLALVNRNGAMHIIAALCMHPVGYYQESHGGCMVPTDDVISHLLTMRADEHYFWRKANQHSIWEPQSGV